MPKNHTRARSRLKTTKAAITAITIQPRVSFMAQSLGSAPPGVQAGAGARAERRSRGPVQAQSTWACRRPAAAGSQEAQPRRAAARLDAREPAASEGEQHDRDAPDRVQQPEAPGVAVGRL